jgi:acetyltransferase
MSYTLDHYPTRWIDVWQLSGGRRVIVRPVLPQDAELEQALVRALSPASRYQRFFAPIRELPQGWLQRLTQIDYRRQQAFIVETFVGDQALAVAEGRYVVDDSGEACEFAVVVADDWQRLGLARRLMHWLMQSAGASGLKRMHGDVLATNHAMRSLAESLGFRALRHPDGGAQVVRVQRDLTDPAASAAIDTRPIGRSTAPGPSAQPAGAAT